MADYQNFKISPSDYLGFEYEDFQNRMYAVALSDPKKYFEIRNAVVKYIRDTTVEAWFRVFYSALTEGVKADGNPIHADLPPPKYPAQEVSRLCIGIGKTVQHIASDVCDKIIPAKFEDLAHKRTHDKANAAGL
jgi:hypothetical protein